MRDVTHRLPRGDGRKTPAGPSTTEEEIQLLRDENRRLRRLLNDPDLLLRRRLKVLAGLGADLIAVPDALLYIQHLTSPISPWW